MSKNKRMVYIKPENVEFYDSLDNKSDFINGALELAQQGGVDSLRATPVTEGEVGSNRQGLETYDAVEAMRERDRKRLEDYRKQHGLPNPTLTEG